MMKLARAVIGTNNVDHCARLCHASTVVGLAAAFGSGEVRCQKSDFRNQIFLYSVFCPLSSVFCPLSSVFCPLSLATLIVVDPRETPLSDKADFFLRHKPGTDVAWLNGFMNIIINQGLHNDAFIRERTEGFEDLAKIVANYTPQKVEQITGIPAEQLTQAACAYAGADSAMILYAMGITQHSTRTDNVKSIANLAMLTGNVGKAHSGVNPLRGQNNVQGACDMGALPNVYSGYQKVCDPDIRQKFEKAWGTSLPAKPGLRQKTDNRGQTT